MQARFTSEDPTENRVCDVFGHSFPIGEWVPVTREAYDKLATNPAFEVDGDENEAPDHDVDTMKAELAALGIKFHHKAGPAKLADLLAEAKA